MGLEKSRSKGTGPLCLLWQRFGPYHHARLKAFRKLHDVVGIEFSSVDPTYQWDKVTSKGGAGLVTLFHDRFSQEIPVAQIQHRLAEVLGAIQPSALAIAGWSGRVPLAALGWCLDHHVPAVLMSPSQRNDSPRVWYKEWPKKRIVRLFGAALVGGAPQKRYLMELGFPRDRIATGYNVVDNGHFFRGAQKARKSAKSLRASLGLPDDFFVVSARFVPKKNLERFLKAYAIYTKCFLKKSWSLIILGEGSGRARLEKSVDELGLRNFVGMPGFKQYNDLPLYYGLAKALVLPSTSEQWGLVVNEGMAAGLPVLVSDRAGCCEDLIGDGENGFLLDPLDAAQMAGALAKIHRCGPIKSMGVRSLEIMRGFSPQSFAQGLSQAVAWAQEAPVKAVGALDRFILKQVMRKNLKGYQDQ